MVDSLNKGLGLDTGGMSNQSQTQPNNASGSNLLNPNQVEFSKQQEQFFMKRTKAASPSAAVQQKSAANKQALKEFEESEFTDL